LEYTDQQRAEFKDAYAEQFRKRLVMMVIFLAALAALALTDDGATLFGLSDEVLGPFALVAMVGAMIFSVRNWNCPACNRGLGRAFNPKHCPKCGIELRG
jgi:hypothetical protein